MARTANVRRVFVDIVKVEPLASAPSAQVAAAVGPTVQRYQSGDRAGVGGPRA